MMINVSTNFPFKGNFNIISYWLNYFVSYLIGQKTLSISFQKHPFNMYYKF